MTYLYQILSLSYIMKSQIAVSSNGYTLSGTKTHGIDATDNKIT